VENAYIMTTIVGLHPVQRDAQSRAHLIAKTGHKWLTCVVIDFPIRLVQLPVHDHGLQPLLYNDMPYSLKRAVRLFRRYVKEHGITDGAKQALDKLKGDAE
jgi:hypothetical protein